MSVALFKSMNVTNFQNIVNLKVTKRTLPKCIFNYSLSINLLLNRPSEQESTSSIYIYKSQIKVISIFLKCPGKV